MQNILEQINSSYSKMSKGHKCISDYIKTDYDKAAFMTAAKLGEHVGVSESTIVRYALRLGYDGYPELQKALQEMIRGKLTTLQRFTMSSDLNGDTLLQSVLKADMHNIRTTMENINTEGFQKAVQMVLEASRVYILGLRSASLLADYLGHYLSFIRPDIHIVTDGSRDVFEQLLRAGKGDVLIGVSFPRYSTRTLEAASFVRSRGCGIIALTDSVNSPLSATADISLTAPSNMASFVDSLVAPLSLANALIVAVGMEHKQEAEQAFGELEKIWKHNRVYAGAETEDKL